MLEVSCQGRWIEDIEHASVGCCDSGQSVGGMPVDDVCGCESSRGKVYNGQPKDIARHLVDQIVVVQLGRENSRIG